MYRAVLQAIAGGLVVARRWDLTSAIASVDKQEVYHFQSSLIWDVERYQSYESAQSFSNQERSRVGDS
jgi:hypothetical protein